MKEDVLNETTSFCNECPRKECCPEEECVLFRIEQIILKEGERMEKSNNISIVLRDGGIYYISKEQVEYWKLLYPELDVESELGYLKEMWSVNAIPRKTAKNINKFINKWLHKQNASNESI